MASDLLQHADDGLHVLELAIALVLSTLIGLEREVRAKSAGLRTHALVGTGAALFMLVSKFGFDDLATHADVSLDPSRVAAQVVSGIGFIGGGLIFVRSDAVRGLTTAATVWLTAAVGMAAGAGLLILAVSATAAHFVVAIGFPWLARRLPRSGTAPSTVDLLYVAGVGTLSRALEEATRRDFIVAQVQVDPPDRPDGLTTSSDVRHVRFVLVGKGPLSPVAGAIENLDGVLEVRAVDANADVE
jgi:putative Mg2+ transporter-C (MgtC) family protein